MDSHIVEQFIIGQDNRIIYSVCPHRNRYPFKKGSELKNYLKNECPVWKDDPEELYTVNFIVVALLSTFKSQDLIKEGNICLTKQLTKVLKLKSGSVKINGLRILALFHLEHREYFINHFTYKLPFWCLNEHRGPIDALLKEYNNQAYEMHYTACKWH